MKEIVAGLEDLEKVVACILESGKRVILLQGTLGSGKTTLVKVFAQRLGEEGVTSPTFSIQQVYGEQIFHYDLYQAGVEKFFALGLFEELFKEGYHFIEWPNEQLEQFFHQVGIEYLKIEIEPRSQERIYRCIDS